jgi:hypothetical protein
MIPSPRNHGRVFPHTWDHLAVPMQVKKEPAAPKAKAWEVFLLCLQIAMGTHMDLKWLAILQGSPWIKNRLGFPIDSRATEPTEGWDPPKRCREIATK